MPDPSSGQPIAYSGRPPQITSGKSKELEAALGAELLDRSVKPPRPNSLGSRKL